MLEKHITLSNETNGLDDPVALNPANFSTMCRLIHDFDGVSIDQIQDEVKKMVGQEKFNLILGSGIKKLAPSEKMNYGRTNRSLRFIKDKKCGQIIEANDIGILRTEKVLEVGLEPKFLDEFIGKRLTKDVMSSDPVLWNCISST